MSYATPQAPAPEPQPSDTKPGGVLGFLEDVPVWLLVALWGLKVVATTAIVRKLRG